MISIEQALYGEQGNFIDVTDTIKYKIKNNDTNFILSQNTFGRDPIKYVRKKLTIKYDASDNYVDEYGEGEYFSIDIGYDLYKKFNKFREAKEPYKNNKNIITLIACYTNSEIKLKAILNNIRILCKYSKKIVIINSPTEFSEKLENLIHSEMDNIEFSYFDNDKYYDFGKWYKYIVHNKKYLSNYDQILFTNDSYILTGDLDAYFNYSETVDTELVGFTDSLCLKLHIQSYFFIIKSSCMDKFINLFRDKENKINSFFDIIKNYELELNNYFINNECFIKTSDYKTKVNVFLCDKFYRSLLINDILPVVKIKRLSLTGQNNFWIYKKLQELIGVTYKISD